MVSPQSLKKWALLADLEDDFLNNVKFAWVYKPDEAFLVTTEDDVFAIGENLDGLHGVGDEKPSLRPRKVVALCQKRITDFAFGAKHVVAMSQRGHAYLWGKNYKGQLGNGSDVDVLLPRLVEGGLKGKFVTAIASGGYHGMALTQDGEVFAWGGNQHGQIGDGTTIPAIAPKKVVARDFPRFHAESIACGHFFSLIVLSRGPVLSWGKNGSGQLGIGNKITQLTPAFLNTLDGGFHEKIVCGPDFGLACGCHLLYKWGDDEHTKPEIILENGVDITDVSAFWSSRMCAAFIEPSKTCYVWGTYQGRDVKALKIKCDSLMEAFRLGHSCYPGVIKVNAKLKSKGNARMAFNCSKTADVAFIVDGRRLYAHKDVLKKRCEYLYNKLGDCMLDNGKKIMKINQYSFLVFKAYLHYLYSNQVDLTSPEDLAELVDLAHSYLDFDLKKLSVDHLARAVTVKNAALLYHVAVKFEVRMLEEYFFEFFLEKIEDIVETEAFSNLDGEVCRAFIIEATRREKFKHSAEFEEFFGL